MKGNTWLGENSSQALPGQPGVSATLTQQTEEHLFSKSPTNLIIRTEQSEKNTIHILCQLASPSCKKTPEW